MTSIVSVNFHGTDLYGFKSDSGDFVALKPIVEAIGLGWGSQYNRLNRDPILSEGVSVMKMPFAGNAGQEVVCLRIDLLQGWLFTIDSARIKDDLVRERVLLYQRECFKVLHEHFTGRRSPRVDVEPPDDKLSINDRRALVAEARQTFGDLVAREVWFATGLIQTPLMLRPPQGELFDYAAIRHDQPAEEAA